MSEPILPIRRPHPKGLSFRRHRQRRRIAGVCAGIEDYTGWDRNLLRFLFLFSLLFGEKFEEIIGFDIVPSSIEKAQEMTKNKFPSKKLNFEVIDLLMLKNPGFCRKKI